MPYQHINKKRGLVTPTLHYIYIVVQKLQNPVTVFFLLQQSFHPEG